LDIHQVSHELGLISTTGDYPFGDSNENRDIPVFAATIRNAQ